MSRNRREHPGTGTGTAWLVADRAHGDYLCYWYGGKHDDDVVEQARAASAGLAVAWGRQRTPRVRIRTAEARTFWAGTARAPRGITLTWRDEAGGRTPVRAHDRRGAVPSLD